MKIQQIQIVNFKSLVDFELNDLKPFCAFVGPNASGKSNVFEALEFTNYLIKFGQEAPTFFGGAESIYSFNPIQKKFDNSQDHYPYQLLNFKFEDGIIISTIGDVDLRSNGAQSKQYIGYASSELNPSGKAYLSIFDIRDTKTRAIFLSKWKDLHLGYDNDYEQFVDNFSRIFVGKTELNRINVSSSNRLQSEGGNLAQILGQIFQSKEKREDFTEWLRILIPEFRDIEIKKSNISEAYDFFIFEKGSNKPFPKNLISDGTKNILSLMAAVYQESSPQFLCIEEPENGLHPQAIELLVDFFRQKVEEEKHYIWLNTHSQSLVRSLNIDEIILINKIDGATCAKQLTSKDVVDIKTDEAWLSNALGGGVI